VRPDLEGRSGRQAVEESHGAVRLPGIGPGGLALEGVDDRCRGLGRSGSGDAESRGEQSDESEERSLPHGVDLPSGGSRGRVRRRARAVVSPSAVTRQGAVTGRRRLVWRKTSSDTAA